MHEQGKSALAIPEIRQVTRKMAGDSPNVLCHHNDEQSPIPSQKCPGCDDKLNGCLSPGLQLPFAKPQFPLCELGFRSLCGLDAKVNKEAQ